MHLQDFICMTCNAALAGGLIYVFGPDLLLHYWPTLSMADACALADPLAVMAGVGGACFSVSPLAVRLAHGWRWGWRQLLSRRAYQRLRDSLWDRRGHRTYAASLPSAFPPPQPRLRGHRIRPSSAAQVSGVSSCAVTRGGTDMNLHQYITWCEQRIATLVVQEGLQVGLLGVVQGPLTLTYRVRLLQPSPKQLNTLLRLGPAVAAAIQAEAVRISQAATAIHLEIPSPIRRTPSALELTYYTQGLQVCIGYDTLRRPVFVDLRQHGAVFWVGPSRRGKTQSLKATLYALIRKNGSRLKFVILCHAGKRENWAAFAPAVGCMGIVTDPAEQHQVLTWAVATLLTQRQRLFRYVLVVDDLLNLLSSADLAGPLGDLASMGAGLGVHLLAATQETGSKRGSGGAGVETNITAKLLYKPSNASTGARSAGQSDVHLNALTGAKGDALLLVDGSGERVATAYIDDRTIWQLPAKVNGVGLVAPWRESCSAHCAPELVQNGLERVQNDLERAGTSQNEQNGTVLPTPDPTTAAPRMGEVGERGVERSALLPLPGNRPPTAQEAALLRTLYQELGSKEQVYFQAWGYKNGKVQRYLTAALTEPSSPAPPEPQAVSGVTAKPVIDLNTPEGQAAVDLLVAHGLLPHDEVTQLVRYRKE